MRNLDLDCMKSAQSVLSDIDGLSEEAKKAAKKYESIATKAMGVLANDGPYACFLFLGQGQYQDYKRKVKNALLNLAKDSLSMDISEDNQDNGMTEIAENLDEYLLLKRVWERTLTYLRYHAKCLQ
jgi:CRISPR/Cas system CMR-associated protein Cmr5 small subunit